MTSQLYSWFWLHEDKSQCCNNEELIEGEYAVNSESNFSFH